MSRSTSADAAFVCTVPSSCSKSSVAIVPPSSRSSAERAELCAPFLGRLGQLARRMSAAWRPLPHRVGERAQHGAGRCKRIFRQRAARRGAGYRAGFRMTAQVTVLYTVAERTRDCEFAQALDRMKAGVALGRSEGDR